MKPERIQEELHVPGEVSHAVQDFLDDHDVWRLGSGGHRLVRDYHFLNARIANAFTQFAAEVSATLDHPCDLELRGGSLRIVVGSNQALTAKDLELAVALGGDPRPRE